MPSILDMLSLAMVLYFVYEADIYSGRNANKPNIMVQAVSNRGISDQ